MRNILRRLAARNLRFLIATSLVLGVFQFLLCALVSSINMEGALQQVLAFAPPIMRALVEQATFGGTNAGVLAFGWNHPVTHAILTAIAITIAARAVAGEVENGAIELVLSQPLSRTRYFAAQVVFGVGAIAWVTLMGCVGTWIGQRVYGLDPFSLGRLAELFGNLVLLMTSIFSITLAFSCFGREGGPAALAGVLVAVLSYLINAIASLWPKAHFALRYSLHTYFDPRKILVDGNLSAEHVLVLTAVTILAATVAYTRLRTRDLP